MASQQSTYARQPAGAVPGADPAGRRAEYRHDQLRAVARTRRDGMQRR